MVLAAFTQALLNEGHLPVEGALAAFAAGDLDESAKILQDFYTEDLLEMPFQAPAFSTGAALWAAGYFYTAVQLTVLRDIKEDTVQQALKEFPGSITPEAIYSADLMLRHLPALFGLAKGLAPADVLVTALHRTALQWPFSSVGIALDGIPDESIILSHASIRQTYIDRIIARKDSSRLKTLAPAMPIRETLGDFINDFWPDLEPLLKQQNHGTGI